MIRYTRGPWLRDMLVFAVLAALVVGCVDGDEGGDPVVATAYDERLHWSDLRQVIPMDLDPVDSAAMASAYVTSWLQQQVVLHKAEENIAEADKDFAPKLRDYRNSLLLFAYEQELVNQKLDTVVTIGTMEAYLEANKVDFELQENIARIRWLKLNVSDDRTRRKLQKAFEGGGPEDMREVELWAAQNGVTINDRSDTWTAWSDLRGELPITLQDRADLLERDQRQVFQDGDQLILMEVLEHRAKGTLSPLPMVEQDVRAIVLNQRKLQLLERMRQDLYREALDRQDIRIH